MNLKLIKKIIKPDFDFLNRNSLLEETKTHKFIYESIYSEILIWCKENIQKFKIESSKFVNNSGTIKFDNNLKIEVKFDNLSVLVLVNDHKVKRSYVYGCDIDRNNFKITNIIVDLVSIKLKIRKLMQSYCV